MTRRVMRWLPIALSAFALLLSAVAAFYAYAAYDVVRNQDSWDGYAIQRLDQKLNCLRTERDTPEADCWPADGLF